MDNTVICKLMESYGEFPSEEKKKKLVSVAATYIFSNLKCILVKLCPHDEDTKSEFILWLYPQIERIIDNFNPSKAAFHTYLSVGVKYRYLRFCEEKSKHREIVETAEKEEIKFLKGYDIENCPDSLCVCDKDEVYEPSCKLEEKKAYCNSYLHKFSGKTDSAKKRMSRDILLLTLKSTFDLSEELIDKISVLYSIPRNELDSLIELVRRDYSERQSIYERLRTQKYNYYLRSQLCCKKISELETGSSVYDREKIKEMEKERDFCDRQSLRLCNRMKKLQRNPSNRYLANLLNMPRGSVNSALARIKKYIFKNGDLTSDI